MFVDGIFVFLSFKQTIANLEAPQKKRITDEEMHKCMVE